MPHIQQRLNCNTLSTTWDIMSLSNVYEPRNAEFTAFLARFLSSDNQMTINLEMTQKIFCIYSVSGCGHC